MHHIGPIAGLAVHGDVVATAGYDNRLILWDATCREAQARASHDHLVNSCAFSPDGRLLVSASSDHTARIWSVPDLRLVSVLGGHGDDVDMARFSPDSRRIATCALDRMVRIYDTSGILLHTMAGHQGNVLSLAWIDARRLVTTSVDGTVREWDAIRGEETCATAIGIRTDCIAVLPDGRLIAGDDKGRIAIFVPGSPPTFTPAHRAGIKTLVLDHDGRGLITIGYDRKLAVWRIDDGTAHAPDASPFVARLVTRSELPAPVWARSAAMLPDGRVATGTFGGTFALFDPATGIWDCAGVTAGRAINAIAEFDGQMLTIGDDGVLRVDGEASASAGSLCSFIVPGPEGIHSGGHLGELVELKTGKIIHRHHSPLNCAVRYLCAGVAHLAVGTYTGEILVFRLDRRPRLVDLIAAHGNAIKSLVAAEGLLMSVSANTDIAWHDAATLGEVRRVQRAHTRIANAACTLGDGVFASVGRDRTLRIWHPLARGFGDAVFETPHPNSVKALAASDCGRWIASGSYGGTVAVFDRETGHFGPLQRVSKSGIAAMCWSPTKRAFMAGDYSGEVHLVTPAPPQVVAPAHFAAHAQVRTPASKTLLAA